MRRGRATGRSRIGLFAFFGCLTLIGAPGVMAASGWTIQSAATPKAGRLLGVSCTGTAACTAVGYFSTPKGVFVTRAERWNGKKWTIQSTPNAPFGATGVNELGGVSCIGTTSCTAVGVSLNGFASDSLAERWNGKKWTIQPTPNPRGYTYLGGVSCTSPAACTAVGYAQSSASSYDAVTLAMRWNGKKWTVQPTPNPTGVSFLWGVSCTGATACTAVGSGSGAPLVERWNGKKWTIQTTPTPTATGEAALRSVSCSGATRCSAAGYYARFNGSSYVYVTLIERWNGKKWTIQPTPNPKGATWSRLSSVSCTGATACTGVGYFKRGSVYAGGVTLAEHWNGTKWTIASTPNPKGTTDSELFGVSCSASTTCTAVGYSSKGSQDSTLAERRP